MRQHKTNNKITIIKNNNKLTRQKKTQKMGKNKQILEKKFMDSYQMREVCKSNLATYLTIYHEVQYSTGIHIGNSCPE